MARAFAITAVISLVAACSSDDEPTGAAESAGSPTGPDTATGPADDPAENPPAASLPVVEEVFGDAEWSLSVPPEGELLVTPTRVVSHDDTTVFAVDESGDEAWSVPLDLLDDREQAIGNQTNHNPTMRLVDTETVAVVETGSRQGTGLEAAANVARVTLIDLISGQTRQVDLDGSESDFPAVEEFGLYFEPAAGGDETLAYTVDAAGTVTEYSQDDDPSPFAVVGDHVLMDSHDDAADWTGAPLPDAFIASSDAENLAVAGDGDTYAWVDLGTGQGVAEGPCGNNALRLIARSPNGAFRAWAGFVYDAATARSRCVGGGEGERTVDFTAVDDDGRAYGMVPPDDGDDGQLVVADLEREDTFPLPTSYAVVQGVMEGGIAVHWDAANGIVTGNPIVAAG
jgi:hypothetical protein